MMDYDFWTFTVMYVGRHAVIISIAAILIHTKFLGYVINYMISSCVLGNFGESLGFTHSQFHTDVE